ncbi:MAG: DUF2867 domain-containing protein [Alphaproteobacteria bacterium]
MITLPDSNIRVLEAVSSLDYFDSQSVKLQREIRPLDVWNLVLAHPQPVLKVAFVIRDAISVLFGVKKIGGFSGTQADRVKVGDFLDFFLVEYSDDTALVLTERDRHLDVMTCISADGPWISVTSSVRVHNWFGHVYMLPVGVAHRWIVHGMLRRLRQKTSANV